MFIRKLYNQILTDPTCGRADMTVAAIPIKRQEVDARAEYRQRMLVNALAASFITLMMIGGYWVVSTLAGVV